MIFDKKKLTLKIKVLGLLKSSQFKKVFCGIYRFGKKLHLVGCVTVSLKGEVMLTHTIAYYYYSTRHALIIGSIDNKK